MTGVRRIGLLGGTLDPVHLGHIETARAARAALALDLVVVLPSRVPPHRVLQPLASPCHRFAMCALAVNGVEGMGLSDMELSAPAPSYTADTLARFQSNAGVTRSQVYFITGADAFADIATWHRYPEVLDLAHFIVVSRPGVSAASMRERLPELAGRMADAAGPGDGVRGSDDARDFGVGGRGDVGIFLVDARTPDVSSTEVRRRLAAGESIHGLVPDAVAAHIHQHRLYPGAAPATANHLHGQY